MIKNVQGQLNIADSDIYLDDREKTGYCLYVAKKAWLAPVEDNITHICALPDDIEPCNGFKSYIERIVNAHPNEIISLFSMDYQDKMPKGYDASISPYVEIRVMFCCGTIIPTKYIHDCFNWIKKIYNDEIPDDNGIQDWACSRGIRCITTIPHLLQHIGDNSLVTPYAKIRRSKHFTKDVPSNVNWESDYVYPREPYMPIFAKNMIKINGIYYPKKKAH